MHLRHTVNCYVTFSFGLMTLSLVPLCSSISVVFIKFPRLCLIDSFCLYGLTSPSGFMVTVTFDLSCCILSWPLTFERLTFVHTSHYGHIMRLRRSNSWIVVERYSRVKSNRIESSLSIGANIFHLSLIILAQVSYSQWPLDWLDCLPIDNTQLMTVYLLVFCPYAAA